MDGLAGLSKPSQISNKNSAELLISINCSSDAKFLVDSRYAVEFSFYSFDAKFLVDAKYGVEFSLQVTVLKGWGEFVYIWTLYLNCCLAGSFCISSLHMVFTYLFIYF